MKLVSVNIEGDRHFNTLLPFFNQEKPDVLCLQEVFLSDLDLIQNETGLTALVFCPQSRVTRDSIHLPGRGKWGVAILSREIVNSQPFYYNGSAETLPEFLVNHDPNSMNRILLTAQIKHEQQIFQLATTHFTWSGDGTVTEEQRRAFTKFKSILVQFDELILCGDLNSPRGKEIFDSLAQDYSDCIPKNITTTVDKNLHKSGKDIQLVVDMLFASSHYRAQNVRVVPNTSDHMAIVAEISHRP